MKQKQYIRNISKIRFYLIVHCILACSATLFLRSYKMTTEEYIHSVLYPHTNLILTFPIFMAIFITLKLAAFVMLGNLAVEMFVSKEAIRLIRYGVSKYYFIHVFRITATILVSTFGTVFFWCFLSNTWSYSVLPVFSYILLICNTILLLNIMNTYIDYRLNNILTAILLIGILCLSETSENAFIKTSNYHIIFFAFILVLYGSINYLLVRRIRKINYL